jgi:hypothetical protein
MIANLSAWQQSHPVANPEPDDFEPDGTAQQWIHQDFEINTSAHESPLSCLCRAFMYIDFSARQVKTSFVLTVGK